MSSQGLRYIAVGLVNSVIGLAVILLLDLVLGIGSLLANALGFAVGAIVSYILNRTFTFRSQRQHRQAVPAFAILIAACWGTNALVLAFLRGVLQWPALPAQSMAVLIYNALFYFGSRSFVFRER
jgi:putative flippase GtrA